MAKRTIDPSKSLAARFPEIAAQWHPTKNENLAPADVSAGSSRKFWWKCDVADDHEWEATLKNRTLNNSGCSCCAGKKTSVTNSLATQFPEIAGQWHPTKNEGVTPANVVAGSSKKFWWKCDVADDHEWQATANGRTSDQKGCPSCAGLQVSVTNSLATRFPEIAARWHPTKNEAVTPADVVAGSHKMFWWKCDLADDHEWQAKPNTRIYMGSGCPSCAGYRVSVTNSLETQFPAIAAQWHPTKNEAVTPADVVAGSHKMFWWKCDVADDHEWKTSARNRTANLSGCPGCSGRHASVTNSLETRFPEIAAQWHPTKNEGVTPADVVAGSSKKFWWKCDVADDHEWQATANGRTSDQKGCPSCAGLQVSVTNRLATRFPEIAAQWDPSKNGDLTPADVVAGSHKKFWWKCDVADDHKWRSTGNNRTSSRGGRGCPFCSGSQVSVTNSLETKFPEVAAQWHPTRNGDLTPGDVVAGSHKMFWWKCDVADEHEWQAAASNRTSRGSGCPDCTLTPRSAQEMRLAHELSALLEFDLETHKVPLGRRKVDVDILLEDLQLVIEFDGAYWHRNKAEKDSAKTVGLEEAGWNVVRIREIPLDSIHVNDVMVKALMPAKQLANLVLTKIEEVTGTEIPGLDEYLASDLPRKEAEAKAAIRAYQAERAAKKAQRARIGNSSRLSATPAK